MAGVDSEEDRNVICRVCLEDVKKAGKQFALLANCTHPFCVGCIDEWWKINAKGSRCPMCRVESLYYSTSDHWETDPERKEEILEGNQVWYEGHVYGSDSDDDYLDESDTLDFSTDEEDRLVRLSLSLAHEEDSADTQSLSSTQSDSLPDEDSDDTGPLDSSSEHLESLESPMVDNEDVSDASSEFHESHAVDSESHESRAADPEQSQRHSSSEAQADESSTHDDHQRQEETEKITTDHAAAHQALGYVSHTPRRSLLPVAIVSPPHAAPLRRTHNRSVTQQQNPSTAQFNIPPSLLLSLPQPYKMSQMPLPHQATPSGWRHVQHLPHPPVNLSHTSAATTRCLASPPPPSQYIPLSSRVSMMDLISPLIPPLHTPPPTLQTAPPQDTPHQEEPSHLVFSGKSSKL